MSWLTAYFRSKHVHSNTSQPVLLSTQLVFVLSEFPLCFFSSFFSLFPLSSFLFFLFSLFSLFCINSPSSLFTSRLHYFCVNPSSKHSTFCLTSFFPFSSPILFIFQFLFSLLFPLQSHFYCSSVRLCLVLLSHFHWRKIKRNCQMPTQHSFQE